MRRIASQLSSYAPHAITFSRRAQWVDVLYGYPPGRAGGAGPLELRPLRDLDLERVSGKPGHLAAGSGIVRRGFFVYVIGDDLLDLAIFDLSEAKPGRLRQVLAGEPSSNEAGTRHDKPT